MSEGIAQGLYLEASAIDHSCIPNAVWSYQGKEMIIRTIDNVEDFSNLRISYLLKLYENTSKRRQKLFLRNAVLRTTWANRRQNKFIGFSKDFLLICITPMQ